MIKKISINYPTFWTWLDIKLDFNDWINLVEMPNGWWKTTVVNTISSFFTWKYPWLKKLPEWNAIIEWTWYNWMMNKGKWIGNPPTNDLYQYIIPWKFFQLTTPEMRNILTKVLKIDYDSFMLKHIPDWNPDLESELKKTRLDFLSKEEILLEDIMKLKSLIINNEEQDFTDVEDFYTKRDMLFKEVEKFNNSIKDNIDYYNDMKNELAIIKNDIDNKIKLSNNLNSKISSLEEKSKCSSCWQDISEDIILNIREDLVRQLTHLNNEILELNNNFKVKENIFNSTVKPEYVDINDILWNSKKFLIDIPNIPLSRFEEYNEYIKQNDNIQYISQQLEEKELQLKKFDTIWIEKRIEEISKVKTLFVEYLQKIISPLPFDIELFQTYKNWSIKPSFIIKKDWVEYSSLSTWNKTLVEIQMAKLFIDALWLDFILIDESSHISKDNLITYIKELALYYQVILFKATWWTEQDLK